MKFCFEILMNFSARRHTEFSNLRTDKQAFYQINYYLLKYNFFSIFSIKFFIRAQFRLIFQQNSFRSFSDIIKTPFFPASLQYFGE